MSQSAALTRAALGVGSMAAAIALPCLLDWIADRTAIRSSSMSGIRAGPGPGTDGRARDPSVFCRACLQVSRLGRKEPSRSRHDRLTPSGDDGRP